MRFLEHYPAKPVPDAIPITERVLLELIKKEPRDANLYFALGNVRLRKSLLEPARRAYECALRFDPSNAELRANLALTLSLQQKSEQAISHLKQSILQNPSLTLPYLHLGRMLIERGDKDGAKSAFEKLLRFEPDMPEALTTLGRICVDEGKIDIGETYLAKAFDSDPNFPDVKTLLGRIAFERGREHYLSGDLTSAFRTWGRAYHHYDPAFKSDQRVSAGMRTLIETSLKNGELDKAIQEFELAAKEEQAQSGTVRALFHKFLFSIGLIGEAYEDETTLDERFSFWRSSLQKRGEYPYAHFRFALIHCYRGELEDALRELRWCQDKLPRKKQDALRIGPLIDFVGEVRDIRQGKGRKLATNTGTEDWAASGFSTVFESEPWKKEGFSPEEARKWKEGRFPPKEAVRWADAKFDTEEASQWSEAGVTSPLDAKQWKRGKIPPLDVGNWIKVSSLPVEESLRWIKAGIADPGEAVKWSKVFLFPWDAVQWRELGFTPEDAAKWVGAGIKNPHLVKKGE